MERDYQGILKSRFEARRLGNPSYSLRAFARDLRVDSSVLAALLKDRSRGVSRATAIKIAKRLGLNEEEQRLFADSVDAYHARSQSARDLARSRLEARSAVKVKSVDLDAMKVISSWHHLAIREWVGTSSFKLDYRRMAKAFSITTAEARDAWDRLRRLELVERDESGRWTAKEWVRTPDGTPSDVLRRYHGQILDRSRHALENVELSERSHTALMLPFHVGSVEEAKRLIREFRRGFSKAIAASRPSERVNDRVYCLSVQLFPLDEREGQSTFEENE